MKKKICFLIGNLNLTGGTERVTTLIANALAENSEYDISILSLADGTTPFFELHPSVETFSLYSHSVSMKKNFFGAVWKIRQFIIDQQVDTLIVVDSISCLFTIPALWGLKVKHICWEHFNFKNNNGTKLRDLARIWAVRYCDNVVTLTKRDKKFWDQGLKKIKAKIVSIPNPTSYKNVEHHPQLAFKVFLAVGRLVNVKGFDMLIDAWARVCHDTHGWKLRIVGSGEEERNLKQQVEYLGITEYVEFISATKNIEKYYRTASFFCLSSRFEGFPMVLLEAQTFGLPIVSYDCDTGPSELVNTNTGILVESNNVSEFANAMANMVVCEEDKYKDLVQNSFILSSQFSIECIKKLWVKIL